MSDSLCLAGCLCLSVIAWVLLVRQYRIRAMALIWEPIKFTERDRKFRETMDEIARKRLANWGNVSKLVIDAPRTNYEGHNTMLPWGDFPRDN